MYDDSGRGRGNKRKLDQRAEGVGGGDGGVAWIDQYYMWGMPREGKPLTHWYVIERPNSLLLDFTSMYANKCLLNGAWNAARRKKPLGIKFHTPATKQLDVSQIRLRPCDAKGWVIFVNDRSKISEPSLRCDNEPRGCAVDL